MQRMFGKLRLVDINKLSTLQRLKYLKPVIVIYLLSILYKESHMITTLAGKDYIETIDWKVEEIETALDVSFDLKRKFALGEPHRLLPDKTLFIYASPDENVLV